MVESAHLVVQRRCPRPAMMPLPEASPPRLPVDRPLLLDDMLALADPAGWPGLRLAYDYAGAPSAGQRRLRLHLEIDAADVLAPSGQLERPARLEAARQRWDGLLRAFAGPGIGWSLECSLDGGTEHPIDAQLLQTLAADAAAWFADQAAGRDVPAPAAKTLELPIEPTNPLDLFELRVELVVQVPAGAGPAARRVAHRVPPRCTPGVTGQVPQLAALAESFEAAAAEPGSLLKLARGHAPGADGAASLPPLWVLRLCQRPQDEPPRGLRWRVQAVRHLAPAPLATERLSLDAVEVPHFDATTGLDTKAGSVCVFTDQCPDELALSAFQGLDQLLAPPLADALAALDRQADPLPREGALAGIRRELAAAVAETLQPVLDTAADPADAQAAAARSEAVQLLQRTLLSGVSQVATLGTVCQLRLSVEGRLAAAGAAEGGPRLNACIVVTETEAAAPGPAPAHATAPTHASAPVSAAAAPIAEARVQLPLDAEPAWASLLLSPPDPTDRTHVLLELRVRPLSIDWPDEDAPQPGAGLRQLHLLRPYAAEMQPPLLGLVDLPLPWRQPPSSPTLLGQSGLQRALPSADAAAVLAASFGWQYALAFTAPVVAQDGLQIELVEAGPAPPATPAARPVHLSGERSGLLEHLARWSQLGPQLLPALQQALEAWQARPADEPALQRAQILAANAVQLLTPLPAAWSAWVAWAPWASTWRGSPARSGLALGVVTAELHEQRRPPGTEPAVAFAYHSKTLAAWRLPAHVAPGPAMLRLSAAADAAGPELPLDEPGSTPQQIATALALPLRRLQLADLSVLACRGLVPRVRVQRNAVLLHDAAGQPLPTHPAFIYSTPVVSLASPCVPLLSHALVLDVATLSTPPRQPLARHFARLFELLCLPLQATDGLPRIELVFARPSGLADVFVRQPVLLLLPQTPELAAEGAAPGVPWPQALAAGVRQWVRQHQAGEGRLELSVARYGQIGNKPWLQGQWAGLYLKTADISDLLADAG